jgi:hypothetical protein
MPNPIEEALKSLNESIALLDETKDLIGEETYLAMKNNLLSIDKNIKRATKGVNDDDENDDDENDDDENDDDEDDDDKDDDTSDISFHMPFTLVVTHNTSFDIVFNIAAAIWSDKDKSREIKSRFENQSSCWNETTKKSRAYTSEQARLHNIDPTDTDVLNFNHYIRLATLHWGRSEKKWYRVGATFNLVGERDYDGVITYD